jgi:transposase-like protein
MQQRPEKQARVTRHEHWRKVIEAAEASGGVIGDYCRRHDIRLGQYYYWRKRLAADQEAGEARAGGEFILVGTAAVASAEAPALELEVGRGWRLRIGVGVDARALRVVLAELATLA